MKRSLVPLLGICISLGLSLGVAAAESFWAQATFVKGDVTFLAKESGESKSLERGHVLHQGDTVVTPEKGKASFLLSDGGILVVPAASRSVLGPSEKAETPSLQNIADNLSQALLSREGDNPMLKHLGGLRGRDRNLALAPCRTKVCCAHTDQRLIWLASPGTKKYEVTLMGPGDNLYEKDTKETFLDIPPEKLVPGVKYYWEVRDGANRDSFSTLGSGSFTTLDEETQEGLRKMEQGIERAFPDADLLEDSTPLFLRYQVYREKGLNLDALVVIEEMLRLNPADNQLTRWRTEVCKDMGISEGDISILVTSRS